MNSVHITLLLVVHLTPFQILLLFNKILIVMYYSLNLFSMNINLIIYEQNTYNMKLNHISITHVVMVFILYGIVTFNCILYKMLITF